MDQETFVICDDFDHDEVNLDDPPETVEHYLKQVKVSRSRCADVVKVNMDFLKISTSRQIIAVCEEKLTPFHTPPPINWQEKQVAEFSLLRSKLVVCRARMKEVDKLMHYSVPSLSDEQGWKLFCLIERSPEIAYLDDDDKFGQYKGTPPILSLLLSLSSPQLNQLFEFQVSWFMTDNENVHRFVLLRWLFSLMTVLDKPLDADVTSALRSLARKCRRLRDDVRETDRIREFSLFITVVSLYFQQYDLSD